MRDEFLAILKSSGLSPLSVFGMSIFRVSQEQGMDMILGLLRDGTHKSCAVYLSGGRTPKDLYTNLGRRTGFRPGLVTLVDERYGKRFHNESNEKMLKDTGFLDFLKKENISFAPILEGQPRQKTTEDFDQKLRELLANYRKHVAILGVGMDGHTAGIPSDPGAWEKYDLWQRSKTEMAIDYDDGGKFYKERITMSFLALSMMDVLLVLVFGKDKKPALEWMFADGPESQVPSRFLKRPEIASKVILITDQEISY